jgi:transglutaminase superfamily protein
MSLLVYQAYGKLIRFEPGLVRGNFRLLYDRVRNYPLSGKAPDPPIVEQVCSAVDLAAIWYPKQVLCLQRSAATTCLLKAYGVRAQMVIGAQQMPFRAHAWVEVDGRVVNDKPYTPEIYAVLDRC